LGIVPFTYATSFLFDNENVAQTVTIFLHFCFGAIGAIGTLILRMIQSTYKIGDSLNLRLKLIPSFCLTNPIMFQSSKEALFKQRRDLKGPADLSLEFIGGDLLALACHFVFWTLMLVVLESQIMAQIPRLLFILPKNRRGKPQS
jgi:hypothetical protein